MIDSIFPVLCVDDTSAHRDFYVQILGLEVMFDCGWYTALCVPGDQSRQVALVKAGHETVPTRFDEPARGCLVTVAVPDVDAVHDRAVDAGHQPVQELRDEPFGQRHFMLEDPGGTLLDVIQWIAPSREFLREVAQWRRSQRAS